MASDEDENKVFHIKQSKVQKAGRQGNNLAKKLDKAVDKSLTKQINKAKKKK